MRALETVRLRLLADHEAQGSGNDIHTLVSILARPMIDISEEGRGTHYARFLEVVRTQPAVADRTRPEHGATTGRCVSSLPRSRQR
ncbi:hypothetical protein APR09_001285 [Nocardia amikacinitolerans]|nr:hypothetical protein [Nocardia amikacinitolerans]